MATLTITTTPRQDKAIQDATDRYNRDLPAGATQLTPVQFFRQHMQHQLNAFEQRFIDTAPDRMTPDDAATVNAILDKYRT